MHWKSFVLGKTIRKQAKYRNWGDRNERRYDNNNNNNKNNKTNNNN